jgi:hypothetical protein
MSQQPLDWTLLLILGLFGLLLWGVARSNASPQIWRWLRLQDKILSLFLLIASFIIFALMALLMGVYLATIKVVIRSLLDFLGISR